MGINRGRRPFEWKIFLPFVAEEGLHVNQQQHLCYYILTWKCLLFQLIHETSNQENLSVPLKMDQSSSFLIRWFEHTLFDKTPYISSIFYNQSYSLINPYSIVRLTNSENELPLIGPPYHSGFL